MALDVHPPPAAARRRLRLHGRAVAFKGRRRLKEREEAELLARADLVFTGGQSLYEAKKRTSITVHAFPSSVDVAHFARRARPRTTPADQAQIPHPRVGFFGVIDERMDLELSPARRCAAGLADRDARARS